MFPRKLCDAWAGGFYPELLETRNSANCVEWPIAGPWHRGHNRPMARAIADIEREIRGLAREDKERLLRALLEELDGPADPNVEQAWLEEVQRRSQELDDGTVTPIPGDEVFARLRASLRQ